MHQLQLIQSSTTIPALSGGGINAKAIIKAIKNTIKAFTFVSTDFNVPQLKQSCSVDDIYMLCLIR